MMAADPWASLRQWTDARIALGRTGDGLPTERVLEFQLAHAKARDAVHTALATDRLASELADFTPILVRSRAFDRAQYLQRPDLGRSLGDASRGLLAPGPYDAVLVVADGLSALAVHENAPALVRALHERMPDWRWAPLVIAEQGRVALGDPIAEALQAEMAVVLIGERPGLSAADSLGAYLTWRPRPGETKDAERNCISNIRRAGLSTDEAAHRIAALMRMARRIAATGIALKEDDAVMALEREDHAATAPLAGPAPAPCTESASTHQSEPP